MSCSFRVVVNGERGGSGGGGEGGKGAVGVGAISLLDVRRTIYNPVSARTLYCCEHFSTGCRYRAELLNSFIVCIVENCFLLTLLKWKQHILSYSSAFSVGDSLSYTLIYPH